MSSSSRSARGSSFEARPPSIPGSLVSPSASCGPWLFGQNQTDLVPPEPRTPHHEFERREQNARLYQALDRLPEVYRSTLILYELEELSGEEVARLTGVPLGTVWVRLHRGRERLMQILSRGEQS